MKKEHIDISTIEGAFTLELKNTEDGNGCFYDVYRHDVYMGELDPYCADCDFDEIDTESEDFDEEGFMNAIEDILIDAVINGELYPHVCSVKTMKKNENEKKVYFPITSVSRDDLDALGFDTKDVSDSTMEHLAKKMADDYMEQLYWTSLRIIAEYLEIPEKGSEEMEE